MERGRLKMPGLVHINLAKKFGPCTAAGCNGLRQAGRNNLCVELSLSLPEKERERVSAPHFLRPTELFAARADHVPPPTACTRGQGRERERESIIQVAR